MARRKQHETATDEPGPGAAIEPIDATLWPPRREQGSPPPPLTDDAWGASRSRHRAPSQLGPASWDGDESSPERSPEPSRDRSPEPSPGADAATAAGERAAGGAGRRDRPASAFRRWSPVVGSLGLTAALVAALAARGDNAGTPPASAIAPSAATPGIVTAARGAADGGVVTAVPSLGAATATPTTGPSPTSSAGTAASIDSIAPSGSSTSNATTVTASTSTSIVGGGSSAPTVPGGARAVPPPIASSSVASDLLAGKADALPWWGEVVDGRIVVRGRIASEAQRRVAVRSVTDRVGADAVVDELVVDPSVAAAPGAGPVPLFVRAPVLFAPQSAKVEPELNPLVGFARYTLFRQPNVRLTVVGWADASEPASLAAQRARAVEAQVAVDPIDPLRVRTLSAGTDSGAVVAADRRVEFVFFGVFDA